MVKQSVGGSSKAAVEIKIGSIVSAALKNKRGGSVVKIGC